MKYFLMLFSIGLMLSCTGNKVIKVNQEDQIKEVEHFFQSLNKKRELVKTMQIEAKADIFTRGKRVRGKLMMSVSKPSMLRVDTLSPFEQPISTMLVYEDQLYFYDFNNKNMLFGDATPNNLSRFLPIRMNVKQFIDMLTGIAPMIVYQDFSFRYIEKTAEYELILINGDVKQTFIYIAHNLQIKSMELTQKEKASIIIKFSSFKEKNGIHYAKKISFEDKVNKSKLKLNLIDVDYNKEIEFGIYEPIKWRYKKEELR